MDTSWVVTTEPLWELQGDRFLYVYVPINFQVILLEILGILLFLVCEERFLFF